MNGRPWSPGVPAGRFLFATAPLLAASLLLGGCEPSRVALEHGGSSGVDPGTVTGRCPVRVRAVVDARADAQGLGRTAYTRIDDNDTVGWVTTAMRNAGFPVEPAADASPGAAVIDVHVKAVYVRPSLSSRVANVVLGVRRPDESQMRIFRGSITRVHVSSSAAAVSRELETALAEAIDLMRSDLDIDCPASVPSG